MLVGFLILLVFQFLGEWLVMLLGMPVPGPVVGMVLLLVALFIKGGVLDGLRTVSEGLLSYLALLYVPAGVGLMVHFRLIANDWLVISVALVVSSLAAFVVTPLLLQRFGRRGLGQEVER